MTLSFNSKNFSVSSTYLFKMSENIFISGKNLVDFANFMSFTNILPCQIHLAFSPSLLLAVVKVRIHGTSKPPLGQVCRILPKPSDSTNYGSPAMNEQGIYYLNMVYSTTVTFPDRMHIARVKKVSCEFSGSLSHGRPAPSTSASQISLYS